MALGEVPLPKGYGYSHALLDPARKAAQLAAHRARVRDIKETRALYNERALQDPKFREALIEKCRRSAQFFIDYFCWTYDDRVSVDFPFVLYDFQVEKIVKPYELFCRVQAPSRVTQGYVKSRGQGYTWVCLALRLWRFLFSDNWSVLIGGENRDDVDDSGQTASHQTMFGKIRYMIGKLPTWMYDTLLGPLFRKEEYNKRWHLTNPKNPRNLIHGKQFGAMFGRSRRYSEIWGDEVAHAEDIEDADTSLKQTTNRASFGSTPKGKHGFFYTLMHGQLKVLRITMWWGEHPELDLAWYNEQREHMTDEQIAQELDLDFELSGGGRVLAEVDTEKHFIVIEGKPFLHDDGLDLEVILDPGLADHFAGVWGQWDRRNQQGRVIDFVQTNRKTVDWIVPFILGEIPERVYHGYGEGGQWIQGWPHTYNEIEMEIIRRHKVWRKPLFVYGDKAGGADNIVTATSAWDVLFKYGISVDEIRIRDDEEALRHVALFMRHVRFARELLTQRNGPEEQSPTMGEIVTQWRYPKAREASTQVIRRPIHDIYCHGGDCLKMWGQVHDLPDPESLPRSAGEIIQQRGNDIEYPEPNEPFRS